MPNSGLVSKTRYDWRIEKNIEENIRNIEENIEDADKKITDASKFIDNE